MIICLRPHMAGLRPAGSHCENSGSSDGTGASARSDRAKSEDFCARSVSAGVGTRCFSPCLIFGCFWIKTKAQKKGTEIDSYFGKHPAPSIRRFLRGADLPPFVTERWRQKCPQGTSLGIGQRLSLSDHARSAPFAHDRSGRSILCPICFRLRCNAEVMVCSAQP